MRHARRRRRQAVVTAVAALLLVTGTSYVRALTYPGSASWSDRSVEWVRDHGGGGVVDAIESWYYSRQAPATSGRPQDALSAPAVGRAVQHRAGSLLPLGAPRVRLVTTLSPAPGEGVWRPLGVGGRMWQTWVRPDPRHPPVVAAAVLVPAGVARLHLVGGTREPVPDPNATGRVPSSALGTLLATFNAGFKMKDSHGGWEVGRSPQVPLVNGRASLVITRAGGWRVGAWGHDVGPAADVAAIRQNLDLVVTGGRPVAGLTSNAHGRWGSAHSQFEYTWRSGIGVDQAGDLIYVAGRSMRLSTFADAMARLGVVEGMELDIHTDMVSFNAVVARHGDQVVMRRLLSTMASSSRRYLKTDQRDFLYLTAVSAP
ncbi:MAG TPA: hypothetical protein VFL94_11645 [Actinomycetales bacterium]|nr:hypothetical protein [Actinomycetales bacterium]